MLNFKEFCKKNKKALVCTGIAVAVIIVIVIALVFASGKEKLEETTTAIEETTTAEEMTTEEMTTSVTGKSILTGEAVSEKIAARRPVAVMINNISDSLPQSGIQNAGVIYEAPVEGGITRMMALFDDYSGLDKIGSIRSCRIYYCYLALEWDAIYCHYGQSKYAKDFLNSDNIDNVSSYNAGGYYYQTSDRYAPHNTYIDEKGINAAIKSLDYRRKYKEGYSERFQFAPVDSQLDLTNGVAAKTVEIAYPHNSPYFQYDQDSGTYLRYQRGDKHIDNQTGEQLSCKNIIIQYVDYSMYPDGKSLDIQLTGKGKGHYITNGKAIDINWEKNEKLGQTKYTDASTGEEITLNTGKSWFCIVQNGTDVTISE